MEILIGPAYLRYVLKLVNAEPEEKMIRYFLSATYISDQIFKCLEVKAECPQKGHLGGYKQDRTYLFTLIVELVKRILFLRVHCGVGRVGAVTCILWFRRLKFRETE